jgi:hypothetical protein
MLKTGQAHGGPSPAEKEEKKRMPDHRYGKPPSFWNELYWFVAIGLMGWILAAMLLPPRVAITSQLLKEERRLTADLRELTEKENLLDGAVSAMENDPFYREGVFRARLSLKKESEEYLEPKLPPIR